MASTYVNDLRLNEMATGDASGTWGEVTNTNLELIAEAFSYGTEAITTNADTHTTTIADGATDPGRSMYLKYTGTLDSACTITIGPNTISKMWFIENATSGSQNIIIKQGSGATITIPPGDVKVVYSDGAGSGAAVVDAFASLSVVDLKVQDDLTVTDDMTVGGTLGVTGVLTATSLDISGDIDVDGTTNLDVVDIDGAVDFASTTAHAGNATFADNAKAIFGAGSDLQIYHDGSNSFVADVGTGVLDIQTNGTEIQMTKGGAELMAKLVPDGAVTLYYDNAAKLATTSTGIDVTGTATIDGLTVNSSEVLFDNTGGDFTLKLNTNAVSDKNEIIMGDTATPLAKFGVGGTANDIITGSDGQDFNIGTAGGGRAINFSTDNFASVEMKLDGGKLGIGTTATDGMLTIKKTGSNIFGDSAITIQSADTNQSTLALGLTGSVAYVDSTESGSGTVLPLVFATGSTEKMRIDSSGNVGIAAVPSGEAAAAHVVRLGDQVCIAEYDDGSNPEQFNLFHNSDSAETYIETGTASVIQQRAGEIIFKNAASGSAGAAISFSERMRIGSNGNTTFSNSIIFSDSAYSAAYSIRRDANALILSGGTSGYYFNRSDNSATDLYIDGSGNVGIGTTSVSASRMQIKGANNTTSAYADGLKVTSNNETVYMQYSWTGMNANDSMKFGIAGSERMRINSSGQLLIGQTAAVGSETVLQASGSDRSGGVVGFYDTDASTSIGNIILRLAFTNDNDCTNASFIHFADGDGTIGSVYAGNASSVVFSTVSDERLKENIVDASSQLQLVKDIKVREFDWKKDGTHQVGFIAQELNNLVPEAVAEGGEDVKENAWGVDYGKLTPYLVKAIQEQQTQIEALQSEINLLKGE